MLVHDMIVTSEQTVVDSTASPTSKPLLTPAVHHRRGSTVHVGGLSGRLERPEELIDRFETVGHVTAVTVRTREDEGKPAWAL